MKNVIVTESGTLGASSANKMTVVIYPFFFFFFKDQKRLGTVRVFATVINIVNLTNNMHSYKVFHFLNKIALNVLSSSLNNKGLV